MAEIKQVNPEVMTEQGNKLDSLIGEWASSVSEIESLKQELDGMWDGLANDQFNVRWEGDLAKYNKLQVTMESYRRAISEAVTNYENYENQINSIVESN